MMGCPERAQGRAHDPREGGWLGVAEHKNPTPAEITIMAAGAVGLIFSFFDFYKIDAIRLGSQSFGGDSVNVWSSGLSPSPRSWWSSSW